MVKVAVVLYSYSYCVAHFNQLIKQVTINQGHLCLVHSVSVLMFIENAVLQC